MIKTFNRKKDAERFIINETRKLLKHRYGYVSISVRIEKFKARGTWSASISATYGE